jgi:uncharacterized membrane protein YfcA
MAGHAGTPSDGLSDTAGPGGLAECPATVEALLHLTPPEYAVALAVVALGTTVQGSVGFGVNLLAVPVMAVLEPEAVPATLSLLALPLGTAMARRERHGVDWSGVGWFMVGRLPGTVLGALVVAAVAGDTLSVLAGAAVLLAVAASLVTATIRITRASTLAAGVASGTMGTATSIGGPPLALLYQHREGPVLRATLAVTFALGTVVSLVGQSVAGALAGWHVALAASLLPGTIVGLWCSGRVASRIDDRRLRPLVLGLAAAAAVAALVRGLA